MVENSRTPRDSETRELFTRTKSWKPPSVLPVPTPEKGVSYRWVRTSALGNSDARNVSAKLREGWVPVAAKDHPELSLMSDKDSRFPEGVEVGGLLLCKISTDIMEQRSEYYARQSQRQMESVDRAYLRDNDPRMPLLSPERKTTTTFGSE